MAITLGPDGFTSDTADLNININNSTTVEQYTSRVKSNKRYRPAFGGYPNGGHGTGSVWNTYSTSFNSTNSGFNASTGRFTAPLEGTYVFNMAGISHTPGTTSTDIRYSMMRNGNQNSAHCITSNNGGNYSPVNNSVTWYLGVGDYVECYVYSGGQAHGGDWNHFSGYYVG